LKLLIVNKRWGKGLASDFTTFLKIVNREKVLSRQSFALTLYIPQFVDAALHDIRNRYDPAALANIPVHITLKRFTSFVAMSDVDLIRQELEKFVKQFQPFQVTLDGYGMFHSPNHNVVFLKVKNPEPLRQLHCQVLGILEKIIPEGGADNYEGAKYVPHVTIGNALSDLDLMVLEHELAQHPENLHFTCEINQMSLVVAFFQEGDWKVVQNFQLGA
jgi:2'-5' RNA ligase